MPSPKRLFLLLAGLLPAFLAVLTLACASSPAPIATLTMEAGDFRDLVLGRRGPLVLRATERIQINGSWLQALGFLGRSRLAPAPQVAERG